MNLTVLGGALAGWLIAASPAVAKTQPPQTSPPLSGNRAQAGHRIGRATVREYKKTIPTYPFVDPNPIPAFERIYPYFRYDRYTNRAVDREWTIVELENTYLRVRVLPEIGGKIWTAIEKSTGRAFIYDNHVVKFRDVAMRGPWTSGGIEPNYGIMGHTPNCATPVDYAIDTRPDGSASVTIGTLDLLTRTSWRLQIALPADKAYFTTRSLWQNTSGLEQPYYTWMNAGIKAAGGLEFVFPGTRYVGHAGEVGAWPIHPENGRNLAFYDQNDFGSYKSYHVVGTYTDFWGAYWHDDDFGMARYSTRDEKPGKKIWIWGLSPQGMIWEKLLTDTDGQYVEVQSGRLFNQASEQSSLTPFKHRGFLPYATDTWTEYWMPVTGTGGFVKANALGALNVRVHAGGVDLAFSPLERIDTTVEVFDDERRVQAIPVSLRPLRTWKTTIGTPIAAERLRVRIAGERFEYTTDQAAAALSRPVAGPPDFDWTSAYGLALKGRNLIRQRMYADAEAAIDASLGKDRHSLPALADKALLRLRAGDDRAAFDVARRAIAVDTYDPQSNYYYGLAAMRLGRSADARDGFDIASQAVEYRAASLLQLARLSMRERQYRAARTYAIRSFDSDREGLEARLVRAVAHRLAGEPARAADAVGEVLARDPLNHTARFETYRLGPSPSSRQAMVDGVRNELRHETFLELAAWYRGLGLEDDAHAVLELAPPVAEVLYWLAYLERARPADAKHSLERARQTSPRLVFPFRVESVPVLTWAMEQQCGGPERCVDWKPAYSLALVERGLGNVERARQLAAGLRAAPDFAPFYVFRAQLAPADAARSLADLQRAAELEPNEWRIGRLLVERAIADRRLAEAEALAARYARDDPSNYMLGMLHARTLLVNARYREALDLLGRLDVLPYEGATEGRTLYREANLRLAVQALSSKRVDEAERYVAAAREWPEHLGVGKPYADDTDERLEAWLLAMSLDARGDASAARAALERIVLSKASHSAVGSLIAALAARRLGRRADGDVLDPRLAREPATVAWARQVLDGQRIPPPDVLSSTDESRVFTAWLLGETPR